MNATAGQIDKTALAACLQRAVPGIGPLKNIAQFNTGQSNPTYLVTTDEKNYVLRTKPPGKLLKSAHQVEREYRVMQALHHTAVPVPEMVVLCDEAESPIGRTFFLMEHIDGRIFWDPALPEIATNAERSAIYAAMNTALADLHNVDPSACGLADFGKPGSYFARQTDRWTKQYQASKTSDFTDMEHLMGWLANNQPDDDGMVSIVHGDYRIDNMIFAPDRPEILALLDWELSTLGHPLADLAYQCMQWRLPNDGDMRGLGGIDRAALGIPTEAEYVARYCEKRHIKAIENWPFYLVFSFFRLAAILQGVGKRALDGNAANAARARKIAAAVPVLAAKAVGIINTET